MEDIRGWLCFASHTADSSNIKIQRPILEASPSILIVEALRTPDQRRCWGTFTVFWRSLWDVVWGTLCEVDWYVMVSIAVVFRDEANALGNHVFVPLCAAAR